MTGPSPDLAAFLILFLVEKGLIFSGLPSTIKHLYYKYTAKLLWSQGADLFGPQACRGVEDLNLTLDKR